MKYDRLLNYIDKHGVVDLPTAITLMDEYNHVNTAYRELNKLCLRKILERDITVDPNTFRRRIKARKITKPDKTHPSYDNNLQEMATFYRYLIRYGAQHFSSPGRVMMMDAMKTWLNQRRDLIEFVDRLQELLDNPPSHSAYLEIEKGLNEAGWYPQDYDTLDKIGDIISMLNPNKVPNFMGISDESWAKLYQYDSLDRVNNAEEGTAPIPDPGPDMNWLEYRGTYSDRWSVEELNDRWQVWLRQRNR